jgi:Holliday junction DNA helicase RuvA
VIGSLRGTLLDRGLGGEVVVEVGGVGYRLTVTPRAQAAMGEPGAPVFVWVHHHQREDAQQLYGFASKAERDTFEVLLGTHGVGRALAMAILSTHDAAALARIVAEGDLRSLCLVPGVGKKTAERLLLELRNRFEAAAGEVPATPVAAAAGALADVREALGGMGFSPDEVRMATDGLGDGDASTLLAAALRRLAARRA